MWQRQKTEVALLYNSVWISSSSLSLLNESSLASEMIEVSVPAITPKINVPLSSTQQTQIFSASVCADRSP